MVLSFWPVGPKFVFGDETPNASRECDVSNSVELADDGVCDAVACVLFVPAHVGFASVESLDEAPDELLSREFLGPAGFLRMSLVLGDVGGDVAGGEGLHRIPFA
jgi:hypothetical protein